MSLETELRHRLATKKILLMTHLVLGYPSFAVNRQVIAAMVEGGVDCIELQIPFSEPMADGPVILKANQESIATGTRVADCLAFAGEMTRQYQIPFLFMTYYNIIFKYGEERFFADCRQAGIAGLIVPDLPPEMGAAYYRLAAETGVAAVPIFAPTSTALRMAELNRIAAGFIYVVARRGVTGKQSHFDGEFESYLARCRAATKLPLAVGFGIRNREDIMAITGKADMAVIGSETIRLVDLHGPEAVAPFISGLR